MNGKLLDTNAIIALQKADPALLQLLAGEEEVFIPAVVLGELYYGAANSNRAQENMAVIHDLAATSAVLACDAVTAQFYGQIRYQLRRKGKPIPENDVWIAAIAWQHGLALVTRDAHFKAVEGLAIVSW